MSWYSDQSIQCNQYTEIPSHSSSFGFSLNFTVLLHFWCQFEPLVKLPHHVVEMHLIIFYIFYCDQMVPQISTTGFHLCTGPRVYIDSTNRQTRGNVCGTSLHWLVATRGLLTPAKGNKSEIKNNTKKHKQSFKLDHPSPPPPHPL